MTDDARPRRQLRLLFSWRETLHAAEIAGARRSAENETAEGGIETCRALHRLRLQRLGKALRKALAADKPDSTRVDALRGEIEFYNSLLRAESTGDLGGPIALPLEAYPAELDALGLPWRAKPTHRTARIMAYLSPSDRKILAALPVCLLLTVLAVLYFARWRGDVRFEFAPGADGTVHVTCTNETARGILLHAPWPEDSPRRAPGRNYGLHVYLQEHVDGDGGAHLRLFPSYGHGWYHQGAPTATLEPLRIAPGLSAEVAFHPDELPLAVQPVALRIAATGERGGEIGAIDVGLGE